MKKRRISGRTFAMALAATTFFAAPSHDAWASSPDASGRNGEASLRAPLSSPAAVDGDLLGTWTINRVKVKKTVDGVSSERTYSAGQKVESFIPCPQRWRMMNSKELEMYFEDGRKEVLEYKLGDGQFSINSLGAIFDYSYSVNGNTMTLTSTFKYGKEEEQLIVDLKKQN